MSEYARKSGHPVLAVVLGILGILIAVLLGLFAGVITGAVAGILGVAALLIGLSSKRNGGRGVGGIIVGALAILLAVLMTLTSISAFKLMKEKAEETGEAPLLVKYMNKPYLGMIGIIVDMPKDEATLDELMRQIDKVK